VTWVKICGITNIEDALAAVETGADALGFVFHQNSPRRVDPEHAGRIVAQLPPYLEIVGVFVDPAVQQINEIAQEVGLTAVQLHSYEFSGEKLKNLLNSHKRKLFVALSAPNLLQSESGLGGFDLPSSSRNQISAIFLDSGNLDQPGGTGRAFDWNRATSMASLIRKDFNLVVAGGLNPENVAEAIHILKPWGVDVSSGVESKPGKKDGAKVRAFIKRARQADATI
jgi:phosphoribosylanthranilate isomerase